MANDSGIGTYIRNILPRLAAARPEWRLTLLGRDAKLRAEPWIDLQRVTVRDCTAPIYSIREQVDVPRHVPGDADLLWVPHFNVPLLYRRRLVVTVHDTAHLSLPEFVRGPAKRAYARLMFAAVGRRAAAVMCDSEFTLRELRRHVPRLRADPAVVHLGVSAEWRREGRGPRLRERPYAIYVGNVKPHKNLGALVRAFAAIAPEVPHDLVIVGRREGMRTIDHAVQRGTEALGDRIVFTGEVSAEALRGYVAHADALVLPSLYEGFGLPPLEAMAIGCPTLVAQAGSLPEVCGDASLYCDPRSVDDMAIQLRRILLDPGLQEDLRQRGRRHVSAYTWERSADTAALVLEGALAARTLGAG